ncbi:FtsX-like permease family protein [Acidobacteria bacterium ACD]|nr:FtsX-like permease family protein [Acidobacteria bacterium ACD]
MKPALFLRQVVRDSRGSRARLAFFAACLGTGVAAVVAVAGLSSALSESIRSQARELLGADVSVESYQPLPGEVTRALAAIPGAVTTRTEELVPVVFAPGGEAAEPGAPPRSLLVELRAVERPYPLHGSVTLDPDRPLVDLLAPDTLVCQPELLRRLGVGVGGTISLGGAAFRVAGTVVAEADRIAGSFRIGPRVFVSREGLARTTLTGFGSRVLRRELVKLPEGMKVAEARRLAGDLSRRFSSLPAVKLESWLDGQPELREAIRRTSRFLGLVALMSLLVGGVGVAQTVRAFLASRLDAIAVLRCLGMTSREAILLYAAQTAGLGLLGSLLGAAAGIGLVALVGGLYADLLPGGALDPWQPAAVGRGLLLGVGISLLFGVPALFAVRRVPPARVLRRDAEPIPPSLAARVLGVLVLVAGVLATAWVQAGMPRVALMFTGGLTLSALFLALAARGLLLAVRHLPRRRVPFALRHGMAALARPGAGTVSSILALGLGVLVVVHIGLMQRDFSRQLAADLPKDAPTAFFLDVQPDQWPGIERTLKEEGATRVDSVPVVMARLTAVDGTRVEDLAARREGGDARRRRWALTREQRLTYVPTLPADNRVVAGSLWSDPSAPEVSLEVDFARENLGVDVGSTLDFDVQGVPLRLKVTSLRSVDWRTFGINFFFVVEPGVLEGAPQQRLAAARLPKEREGRIQDLLARDAPNVVLIRTREVLERVAEVASRMGQAVRALGGFSVLAGLVILGGAVSAGSARRAREVALLKVLGVRRAGAALVLGVEYALVGLVAGVVGTAGAAALTGAILRAAFEIPFRPDPLVLLLAPVAAALLAALAGLSVSVPALQQRPLDVLRGE